MKTPCARNVSIDTVDTTPDPFLCVPGLTGVGITQFDHADEAHLMAGIELLAGREARVVGHGGRFYVQLGAAATSAELAWRIPAPSLPRALATGP